MLSTIVYYLINMSIMASFIFLLVLFLRFIGRKWLTKNLSFILWFLVLIRLLVPFSFSSDYSLLNMFEEDIVKSVPLTMKPISEEKGLSLYTSNTLQEVDDYDQMTYTRSGFEKGLKVFSYIWFVGFLIVTSWMFFLHMRFKKSLDLERESKGIYRSSYIKAPFVMGAIKAKIVLPRHMDQSLEEIVLLHEKTHIRRKDNLWKFLFMVAAAIHWFNPFTWIMFQIVNHDIELSCDESIIRKMTRESVKDYALSLVMANEQIGKYRTAFSGSSLKNRVDSIVNYKRTSFGMFIFLMMLYLVLGVVLLTNK